MKLIYAEVTDFQGLKKVRIEPGGGLSLLCGRNAVGKTSLIRAIRSALLGLRDAPKAPIRRGCEKALVELGLGEGDEVEYIVRRSFTANGSYLTVSNSDGAKYGQKKLDSIVGRLAIDPLEFSRLRPSKQFSELRSIVDLGEDYDSLEADRKRIEENAKELRSIVKELGGRIDNMGGYPEDYPEDYPDKRIDTAEIAAELQKAGLRNGGNYRERMKLEDDQNDVCKTREEILKFERDLKLMKEKLAIQEGEFEEQAKKVKALIDVDAESIKERLDEIDSHNRMVDLHEKLLEMTAERDQKAEAVKRLESDAAGIEARQQELLESAEMPVEGLGFGDGVVTFNGAPLDQASGSEQLKICGAMAMNMKGIRMDGRLRLILITDGSLLDSANLGIYEEMAEEAGFQVVIERVDESGKTGFVIEDGELVNVE